MRVQIRLFAALRERAGQDTLALELPEGARVADALQALDWLTGDVRTVMAVNRDYASADTPLAPGDELALIPPVSGGAGVSAGSGVPRPPHVRISAEPLSLEDVSARVRDPGAGAVVSFMGVTREVPSLEYEAYAEMAERELRRIASAAAERHGLCAVAVEHRTGTVALSEPSVVIAVSAPHRAAAFAGAREIIDTIKAMAPIWKREQGAWVEGHAVEPPVEPPADPVAPPLRSH